MLKMPYKDRAKEREYWRRKAKKYREKHKEQYNAYQRAYQRKRRQAGLIKQFRPSEGLLTSFIMDNPIDFGFSRFIIATKGAGYDLLGIKADNTMQRIEVETILNGSRLQHHQHDLSKIDVFICYYTSKSNLGKETLLIDKDKFRLWLSEIPPLEEELSSFSRKVEYGDHLLGGIIST